MPTLRRLGGLALLLACLTAAVAQDDPYLAIRTADFQSPQAKDAILTLIRDAKGDLGQSAAIEAKLVDALEAPATTLSGQYAITELLYMIGTARSVPAVGKLLATPELVDVAVFALQNNPSPEAGQALREAVAKTSGNGRIGVVQALGERRDNAAVDVVKPLLGADAETATAAAVALGLIGTPESAAALASAPTTEPVQRALIRAGELLVQAGQPKPAEAAFLRVAQSDALVPIMAAALRGLAVSGAPAALPMALGVAAGNDPYLAKQGARLAAILQDADTVARFTAAYPSLKPSVQAVLLAALGDRGDKAAAPLAIQALDSPEPEVRKAAIAACLELADADAVESLLVMAIGDDKEFKALAHEALSRLPGADVEEKILANAGAGQEATRLEMIDLIAARPIRRGVANLLEIAMDENAKIATAAWKSTERMATPADYGLMVKLLLAMGPKGPRGAAETAVITAARRVGDPAKSTAPLLAGLKGADADTAESILNVLAAIGGEQAIGAIVAASKSDHEDLRDVAIDILANAWQDSLALPRLLELAKGDDADVSGIALRGYLRLLREDGKLKDQDKLANLEAILPLADKTARKKQVLSVLRAIRLPRSATLCAAYLDDEELVEDAAGAIFALASPLEVNKKKLPAVTGKEVDEAVAKARKARGEGLPEAWVDGDVGDVKAAGSVSFKDGKYTIRAAGSDIWGGSDSGHLLYRSAKGDVTVVAQVLSVKETDGWAKAGVMLRSSTAANARNVGLLITASKLATFQTRPADGQQTVSTKAGHECGAPHWVKLERRGNTVTGFESEDGKDWQKVAESKVDLGVEIVVGVGVTAHKADAVTEAVIAQLSIAGG